MPVERLPAAVQIKHVPRDDRESKADDAADGGDGDGGAGAPATTRPLHLIQMRQHHLEVPREPGRGDLHNQTGSPSRSVGV
jgi:hypothetical protein